MKTIKNNAPFGLHVLTLDANTGDIIDDENINGNTRRNELSNTPNDFWIVVGCESEFTFSFSIRMPLKIKRVVVNPELKDSGGMPSEYNTVAYWVSLSASLDDSEDEHDEEEDMEVDNDHTIPIAIA